jgi:hypothetical protein
MNRRGAALFVALVVVLLGGMLVVVSSMVAAAEIRAGAAWGEQQRASGLGAGAFARALPTLEAGFDSTAIGGTLVLDDTVSLTRLGDSIALVAVTARSRLGQEEYVSIAKAGTDSSGVRRLGVPVRSRVRFHPIP